MRARLTGDGRLAMCALAAWLVVFGTVVSRVTDGGAQAVVVATIVGVALAGLLLRDWRETVAVGLAGVAVAAWAVSGDGDVLTLILVPLGVMLTGLLASRARPKPAPQIVELPDGDQPATPAPAGIRLPPGVADEALLDRLAVHEMTRARRYERPLALLLIGIEDWSTLVAERGRKTAFDLLSTLATRARRILRDVDAI